MTCLDLHDHLDAHLDGELAPEQAAALEAHAAGCTACAAELALAGRLQLALHDSPPAPCPDAVFDAALARIASLERERAPVGVHAPARDRTPLPRLARPRWRVVVATMTVAAALALGALPFLGRTAEPTFSAEEIAEARRQVELAFSLVGDAGRDAGLFLHDNVVGPKVVTPIRRNMSAQ
jgi:anti-sigma factor RsiW